MKWMLYGDDTDYKIQLPGQENNYDYKQLNVYAKSGHVFPSGLRLPSSTDQEEKLLDNIILFLQSDSDTLRFSAAKFLFDLFQVCVSVCVHVCVCVCVCACICALVCVSSVLFCAHVFVCIWVCVFIYVSVFVCVSVYVFAYIVYLFLHVYVCMCRDVCVWCDV